MLEYISPELKYTYDRVSKTRQAFDSSIKSNFENLAVNRVMSDMKIKVRFQYNANWFTYIFLFLIDENKNN